MLLVWSEAKEMGRYIIGSCHYTLCKCNKKLCHVIFALDLMIITFVVIKTCFKFYIFFNKFPPKLNKHVERVFFFFMICNLTLSTCVSTFLFGMPIIKSMALNRDSWILDFSRVLSNILYLQVKCIDYHILFYVYFNGKEWANIVTKFQQEVLS